SRVLAFEPVPHNFEILEKVIRRARLSNVSAAPLALSDVTGEARMTVPVEGFYGGYYIAAFDDRGGFSVATSTIDNLIASGSPEPDFIKCDVEGAEERVLSGARSLITRRRPIWLLETFRDGVIGMAQSLGYRTFVNLADGTLEEVDRLRGSHRNYWLLPRQ